jgi:N-acetyl-alpha-D-glucosaminyl L-malate synthase BshA
MKIAIVCYPTFGGSGVVATELGIELSKNGHEIHFVTYSHPVRLEALNAKLHFHEVNVPRYSLFKFQPYELALSTRLVDVVKENKIEILHVHYAIPHAYAAYMAKKMLQDEGLNIPIVTTLHGTDITLVGSHPFYKTAVSFSINHSDCITAVSKSLKNDTIELFDIEKEIDVIHNFIDVEKIISKETPCERNLLAKKDEKIVVHISNFRPLKRIMDVVYVFEQIRSKINAKLIMVGEGPEKSKAQRYCKKNNLSDKVIFLGNSSEVDDILCFSDLFLLLSEKESFGLSALEAMVHKVPVISTNVGGLPELNKNNYSGFLFDIGEINKMAKKSIEILSNEKLLKTYKNQAFENAKRFDIKKIIKKYESVYKKAKEIK